MPLHESLDPELRPISAPSTPDNQGPVRVFRDAPGHDVGLTLVDARVVSHAPSPAART